MGVFYSRLAILAIVGLMASPATSAGPKAGLAEYPFKDPHEIYNKDNPTPLPRTDFIKAPLAESVALCYNESDLPGHADISAEGLHWHVGDFVSIMRTKIENAKPGYAISKTYGTTGVNYYFEARWAENCVLESGQQALNVPFGEDEKDPDKLPYAMFMKAYYLCNNGGVGGVIRVGCQFYRFTGGL